MIEQHEQRNTKRFQMVGGRELSASFANKDWNRHSRDRNEAGGVETP